MNSAMSRYSSFRPRSRVSASPRAAATCSHTKFIMVQRILTNHVMSQYTLIALSNCKVTWFEPGLTYIAVVDQLKAKRQPLQTSEFVFARNSFCLIFIVESS